MKKKPTVTGVPTCGNCYYYRPTPTKDFGFCRRFPPIVTAVDDEGNVYCEQPIIDINHDSCGEFANGPRVVN